MAFSYKWLGAALGLIILVFEGWITLAGLFFPHVDKAYYDYFIAHNRSFYVTDEMARQATISLRRDHLKIIDLDPGSADFLLRDGWYPVESFGVWSEGKIATLEFPRDGDKTSLTLSLKAFSPRNDQAVTVFIDGVRVARTAVSGRGVSHLSLNVPGDKQTMLELSIHIAHPAAPASFSRNGDTRQLGIGLVSIDWH